MNDLDILKNAWQKAHNDSNVLSEDNIRSILRDKNKSMLDKLIHMEKLFIWLTPLLILIFWGLMYVQSIAKGEFTCGLIWIGSIFTVYCIYVIISQIYKYNYLKKIDMINMSVITVSTLIAKYKRYTTYELIIGMCWAVPFVISIILVGIGTTAPTWTYIFFILYSITIFAIALYINNKLYFKRIKVIQQTLKEIEEFEKEE